MIKSEIIADSKNACGNRLTTFILEYPRYVHSELMTHRVFSKNAASSRAIPIRKMIQEVIDNPAMPVHWGANQKGMQAQEELSDGNKEYAKNVWIQARDSAIKYVEKLNEIGLHKQVANRLLEPWFHIRIILSGTEFENWFALRAHQDAHPDISRLAYDMLDDYNKSNPKDLREGQWHVPFGDEIDEVKVRSILNKMHGFADSGDIEGMKRKIAVARCARISYLNYEGKDDYEADIKLCDRLFKNNPKHLSPTEHVAQALSTSAQSGNFRGFKQYRKFFPDENLSDERVVKK